MMAFFSLFSPKCAGCRKPIKTVNNYDKSTYNIKLRFQILFLKSGMNCKCIESALGARKTLASRTLLLRDLWKNSW